ncbi:MAG: hypothetical protein PHD29_08750 [bacterium]|nr:hypothetical protein [bacterium]MDD5354243.1 hypothetical protein [bacterium]MDD5756070.1 hypothetical protein [bacterium]
MKKILVLGIAVCAMILLAGYLQAEEAAAGDTEKFSVQENAVSITSTVTGNIDLDKEKLPPFKIEQISLRKFKHDAIVRGLADNKTEKTMYSTNDHVIISAGSRKGIAEGDMVLIFKKGNLVTDRISIDKIQNSMYTDETQERKEGPKATSIGEARVTKVESNSSVIQILRCIESIEPGNFVKIKK